MRVYPAFASLLLGLLCGFANAQDAVTPKAPPPASALDASLFYQILLGELNWRADEPGAAFSILLDAARKTQDPALYRRAVQMALQARSGESALQAARAWAKSMPSSQEANRYTLQILLGLNRVAETLEPLKNEIALTEPAKRRDLIWALPSLYERAQDKQAVVSLMQKALAESLKSPELGATAWSALGRMWHSAGDTQKALEAAQQAQRQDVQSEHAALLALALLAADVPQAETLVQNHLEYARPELRMAYVKTLLTTRRSADATTQLQALRQRSPDYAEAWLVQGALNLQQGMADAAEPQLLHYLELARSNTQGANPQAAQRGQSQAYLALAQIAQQRRDLAAAEQWLNRVDNPDDVLRAQTQRAALMARQGRLEDAILLIRAQPEHSENDARFKRSAEVQLLRENKLYGRARDTLRSFIAERPEEPDLVYELAMVQEKLGDFADMERLLRQQMTSRPDDPHVYNALGYSLADRGERLPEAMALITKALELAPNDPYITDSLAWAHFRSGNLTEARRLLQQAFTDRPDAEIAAHLGEVLWLSNERSQAIDTFQQGLKLNPDNETLRETLRRLRVPL